MIARSAVLSRPAAIAVHIVLIPFSCGRLATVLRARGVEIVTVSRGHGGVRNIRVVARSGDGTGDGGDGGRSTPSPV